MTRLRALAIALFVVIAGAFVLARSQSERESERVAASAAVDPDRDDALAPRASSRVTEIRSAGAKAAKDWFVVRGASIDLVGRVHADGKPAQGISIVVRDELTSEGALPPVRVATDEAGRFVARLPKIHGHYRVVAAAAGLAPAWAIVPGDVSKDDVELALYTCMIHIYGAVSDASGGPVAGASVSLDKVPDHAAASDAAGRFQLCTGPRSAKLRVEAEGYGAWTKSVAPRGALRQDVTLVPAAGLEGRVVSAASGSSIPFALVTVRASGGAVADVQADDAGAFDIARISPGAYTVEARAPGSKSHHPVDVAVFASSKANVTVPLDARVAVRGRVVSKDGPVAGATVNVGYSSTFEWATAVRSNQAGEIAIDDAPVGNLVVNVDDHEVEAPKTLSVPETGVEGVTIQVAAKGEVEIAVTRKGAPVSDAIVHLRGTLSSDTRPTSGSGVARFRGLADGTYRVVAEHDDDFAVAERLEVSRAQPVKTSLELTEGRQVAGRVIDERGDPVDGARVTFTMASSTAEGGASATSGRDGSFRGGPLRGPATYRVRVTRSGFELE
ncbi:MAG: carboxypeptidase regulatory-like domain-containing protein, partial [Labilithrix sp.]|nr:carboxypeptidase regulatory-like domain-containing protein [Labilithrix sp.]